MRALRERERESSAIVYAGRTLAGRLSKRGHSAGCWIVKAHTESTSRCTVLPACHLDCSPSHDQPGLTGGRQRVTDAVQRGAAAAAADTLLHASMSVFASLRRSVGLGSSPPKQAVPLQEEASLIASRPSSPTKAVKQPRNDEKEHSLPNPTSQENAAAGAAASMHVLAYLVLENKKGADKVTYPICKPVTKIGRLPSNDIRVYRESVSRVHCEVHVDRDGYRAHLQVFNPRGVRVNGEDVGRNAGDQRHFELKDGDLLGIYSNYFRMRFPNKDADTATETDDENATRFSSKTSRKALRMSLVRAAVVNTPGPSRPSVTSGRNDRSPLKELTRDQYEQVQGSDAEVAQDMAENLFLEPPLRSPHKLPPIRPECDQARKGRRSLIFSTPKREQPRSVPWTAEPTKQMHRRDESALQPMKLTNQRALAVTTQHENSEQSGIDDSDESVVVMEEIDDGEQDDGVELAKEDELEAKESAQENFAVQPSTPISRSPVKDIEKPLERLTQSSSPKKSRRRSSFFGRAGVFANWNFGFYPEERKATEQEQVAEEPYPITSPEGIHHLPEPRLDEAGRPRLPRSLSSPGGLGYSSPKRRVVSLRTATLLRQGQQAFEQQKSRSPPPSPTKSGSMGSSLMGQMCQLTPLPPLTEGDLPAKESKFRNDADDEDEVDRSLSMADDEDGESDPVAPLQSTRDMSKPRRSDPFTLQAAKAPERDAKTLSKKGRLSMPAKLVSIGFVDGHSTGDIEELKRQWLAEQQSDEHGARQADDWPSDFASPGDGSVNESDTDSEVENEMQLPAVPEAVQQAAITAADEQDRDLEAKQESSPPSPSIKFGMLRYMVRENAELTALIDTVSESNVSAATGKGATMSMPAMSPAPAHRQTISAETPLVVEARESVVEENDSVDAVGGKGDGEIDGWQLVSPRRNKWKPVEPVKISGHRASEGGGGTKQSGRTASAKKAKRRNTAAPAMSSVPIAAQGSQVIDIITIALAAPETDVESSQIQVLRDQAQTPDGDSSIKDHNLDEKDAQEGLSCHLLQQDVQLGLSVSGDVESPALQRSAVLSTPTVSARSPAKRAPSPTKVTIEPDEKVEEASAVTLATASPSKRARSKRDVSTSPDQHAEPASVSPRKRRAAKEAAVAAIAGSPDKGQQAALTSSSPSKRLPNKVSNRSLRGRRHATEQLSSDPKTDVGDESDVNAMPLPPSSPTKRTKRALAYAKQEERNTLKAVEQTEELAVSPGKANTTHRRAARGKQTAKSTVTASEPASVPAPSQDGMRTTRSGRSVRKPTDLQQPTTVVVQSDPVGRVTRSRARKAAG